MPIVGDLLAGRYRIDAALGAGATAVVYRARDLRLERDVAVKVLLPNLARDPLIAGRFDREARALAGGPHPGIVSIYDVDRGDPITGREPFFVMELCDGGSLADTLDDAGGRMSPETVVPLIATIAAGLASLHARGVIHRDVKPHNILLCGGGAKLADFGLARGPEMTRLTAEGTGAGTLAYLAPELLGGTEPGPPADIYGLGVVAFQALTGRMPRPSASMVDLVDTRLAPAAPVSAVAPDLGNAFDGVIGAALAPDPARRPPPTAFADGLVRALAQWRARRPGQLRAAPVGRPDDSTQQIRVPSMAPPPSQPRFVRSGGQRRSLFGPLIAAAALGVLVAIVILVVVQSAGVGPGPTASPTRRPTPAPTVAPTGSPTPAPTATPTPSPTATPTPTPTPTATPTLPLVPTQPPTLPPTAVIWSPSQAQTALENVYRAIDNGVGIAAFTDERVADELRKAADAVQTPLAKENQKMTARAAGKLNDKLTQLVNAGRITNAAELRNVIGNLLNTVGPE